MEDLPEYEDPEFDPAKVRIFLLDQMRTILRDSDGNGALKTLWVVPDPVREVSQNYPSKRAKHLGGYMAIMSAGIRKYAGLNEYLGLVFTVLLRNGESAYQVFRRSPNSLLVQEEYIRPAEPLDSLSANDAADDSYISDILSETEFRPDETAKFAKLFYETYPGLQVELPATVGPFVAADPATAKWQQYGEYLVQRSQRPPSAPGSTEV